MSVLFVCGIAVLMCASAFFSSYETAVFSLSRYTLHVLKNEGGRLNNILVRLHGHPKETLDTILIGNTFVNITISTVFANIVFHKFGRSVAVETILVVCISFVILIFGEIMPKVVGYRFNKQESVLLSPVTRALVVLMYPVRILIDAVVGVVMRFVKIEGAFKIEDAEVQLMRLIKSSHRDFSSFEQNMIKNILGYDRKKLDEVAVPRTFIKALNGSNSIEYIYRECALAQKRYVPLHKGDIESVYAILDARRFLLPARPDQRHFTQCLEKPFFVPGNINLRQAFELFKLRKERIALVVNEYGNVTGLVTLKNILNEITGGMLTNLSRKSSLPRLKNKISFRIKGDMPIEEFNSQSGVAIRTGESATIGGLVCELLGKVPVKGESVELDNVRIVVLKAKKSKVEELMVIRKDTSQETDEQDVQQ